MGGWASRRAKASFAVHRHVDGEPAQTLAGGEAPQGRGVHGGHERIVLHEQHAVAGPAGLGVGGGGGGEPLQAAAVLDAVGRDPDGDARGLDEPPGRMRTTSTSSSAGSRSSGNESRSASRSPTSNSRSVRMKSPPAERFSV